MTELAILPSFITSFLLLAIAVYLLTQRARKPYIPTLSLLCFVLFLWNVGHIMTNVTGGGILWANMSTLSLIFIPAVGFHFTAEYTGYFRSRYYLLAYIPTVLLAVSVPLEQYVTGTVYLAYGWEPVYDATYLVINSWMGLFFLFLSALLLIRHYRESVGIKKRQILFILLAIPANTLLSFLSYGVMVEMLDIAQFPVGAALDIIMVGLIAYAIVRFKLPVGTASEINFRVLSETASEGICILDAEGNIDYANSHCTAMLAGPDARILGKPFRPYVAETSRPAFDEALHTTLSGRAITNHPLQLRGHSNVVYAEINTSPIEWHDQILGAFVTIRDVTQREQTERELKRQKTYFQALFEDSPEAIVSTDPEHRVIDVNSSFTSLFGYTIDEIHGRDIDDFLLPGDRQEEGREFTRQVVSGQSFATETIRKRKDGSLVPVSVLGAPIFIDDEQIGVFGIYRDITERKDAEEEREFYNLLLRHDVANRNMVVYGNLQMLEATSLDPEQQGMLSNALHAIRSSIDLIQKIRDLRTIEGEHEPEAMSLDDCISRAIRGAAHQADEAGVDIHYDGTSAAVMASPLLENVFSNLIQNAIVHADCANVTVTVARDDGGEHCIATVSDDGVGIPPEKREDLFRPGKKRRGSPGSGLGLYLVKKIVENYGGHIAVRTPDDGGTMFTVSLRCA
ncbi:MAG: PAS domain S-box protein [Thermoplasmatota archaeon]